MGWANSSNVTTTHLDSDADSPTSARPEIKKALDELTNVINGRDTANGVCGLDSDTLVPNSKLPATLTTTGSNNLQLQPATDMVKIDKFINLAPVAYAALPTSPAMGDMAFLTTDGAGDTQNQMIYYNGSAWKYFNSTTDGGTDATVDAS